MKTHNIILLMAGSIVLTAGAIAFGYYLSTEYGTEKEETSESTTTKSGSSSSSGLKVIGATDEAEANSLPTPEEFAVYEQYLNAEAAMFQDVVEGTGVEVSGGDNVAVIYKGWLSNGQLFDESRTNEAGELETFNFQLGGRQVITGWEQGIAGMRVGGKRRIIVPPVVGYGEAGQGQIPPNALLIFDVELIQAYKDQGPESGL